MPYDIYLEMKSKKKNRFYDKKFYKNSIIFPRTEDQFFEYSKIYEKKFLLIVILWNRKFTMMKFYKNFEINKRQFIKKKKKFSRYKNSIFFERKIIRSRLDLCTLDLGSWLKIRYRRQSESVREKIYSNDSPRSPFIYIYIYI